MPTEFKTTSRIVIIANEWKTLNENVTAVVDRGHFVYFEPDAWAVHEQVRGWFSDDDCQWLLASQVGASSQAQGGHAIPERRGAREEFKRLGGGSRAAYFNQAKKLKRVA